MCTSPLKNSALWGTGLVHCEICEWGPFSWWRHRMETFSALLAICAGNSPVTGEFPSQRPVTRSFGVFFDMRTNERLSKQSWGWWFETPWLSLWRHNSGVCYLRPIMSKAPVWILAIKRAMSLASEPLFTKYTTYNRPDKVNGQSWKDMERDPSEDMDPLITKKMVGDPRSLSIVICTIRGLKVWSTPVRQVAAEAHSSPHQQSMLECSPNHCTLALITPQGTSKGWRKGEEKPDAQLQLIGLCGKLRWIIYPPNASRVSMLGVLKS